MRDGASPTTLLYIAITMIVVCLAILVLRRVSPAFRDWTEGQVAKSQRRNEEMHGVGEE
jgi:hypothetical protein